MIELKNCPFCNSRPDYGVKYAGTTMQDNTKVAAFIRCQPCGVEMKTEFIGLELKSVPFERYTDVFNNLIKKWNSRKVVK